MEYFKLYFPGYLRYQRHNRVFFHDLSCKYMILVTPKSREWARVSVKIISLQNYFTPKP